MIRLTSRRPLYPPARPGCLCSPTDWLCSDLHEVIDLRAAFNHRAPEGGAIDRDIGSQFHIVFDTDNTQLGNLMMPPFVLHVPKAVAPDDGAAMNDHSGADEASFPHRHIRIEHAVVADRDIVSDKDAGVEVPLAPMPARSPSVTNGPMDDSWPFLGLAECDLVGDAA